MKMYAELRIRLLYRRIDRPAFHGSAVDERANVAACRERLARAKYRALDRHSPALDAPKLEHLRRNFRAEHALEPVENLKIALRAEDDARVFGERYRQIGKRERVEPAKPDYVRSLHVVAL